jgi:hypothetical protein
MGLRRTVSVLVLLLVAGCGGTETETSTDRSKDDPADANVQQRLAVPEPRRPPPPTYPPSRAAGGGYARYLVAGAVEYAMRSGFTTDLRVDALTSPRGRTILRKIDDEYAKGHRIEMTPIIVEALRVDRGPFQVDASGNVTHRRDPNDWFYWTVSIKYRVDELSILDGDHEIATARDLVFSDQMVVAHGYKWRVANWESKASDPDAPILAQVPKAAA